MRFGLKAKSVANVNDISAGLIRSRRIIFTPNTDLKDELAKTAVQITCYDRNGNEVKRVTSTDPGTVEDPENEGGSGEESGSSDGQQSPSGSNAPQGGDSAGGDMD